MVRLLVALFLVLAPVVYAAPAASAAPASLDLGCDNDEPPIPASPRGPGSLIVQVTEPPGKDADPFTDEDVTLESVYGTTPQWWTYKNGCTGQFIASAGTAVGNIILELSGVVPNWTHALLGSVVAPDSWLQALTAPVVDATRAVTEAVWAPWLTVVFLLVGAVVLWRARAGAFAGSVHAGAWAIGVLFVVSFLIQYPAEAVRGVDWGVRTLTTTFITAFNADAPRPREGEDPAVVAVAGQMDDIVRSTQYEAWLSGALGDAHSETARTYGPDLFRATHLSWAEADTYQKDPAGQGAHVVEAKQEQFKRIAEEIERSDPVAYEHLRGEHWNKRATTALVNAVAVVVVCGYLLVAGLVILLSYALIRLVVPFAPAAGVLFMIDATRDMAVGSLKRVIGPLVMGPVYFLVALVLLRIDTSILASEVPWPLQIMIIGVLAWFAWTMTKPATYGIGLLGHAAGFAWSFAAGRARRTWRQPTQHTQRELATATTTPTRAPSQHVVFMPGVSDRAISAPSLAPEAHDVQTAAQGAAQFAEPIEPSSRRSAIAAFPPPTVLRRVKEARLGSRTRFRYDNREPNTAYEVAGRGTFYTDDLGKVVHSVTDYGDRQYPNPDLNAPEPGMTYVVGDRHVFVTDEQGRTITATDPQPSPATAHRSQSIQQSVGSGAGEGYDGGHLIMHAHGGGRERINIVAQLAEMNRSGTLKYGSLPNSFYKFERFLNDEVNQGKDVYLTLYVDYEDDETRTPDLITAEYKIDGQVRRRRFPNVR